MAMTKANIHTKFLTKSLLAMSAMALSAAGCGGLEPDSLWAVTRLDSARPASCYAGGMLPNPDRTTTVTGVQRNVGPWEIYQGSNNKFFLMMGDSQTVYEGVKMDGYRFEWTTQTTAKETFPVKRTTTDTYTNVLSFKIDGETLDGKVEVRETHTCSGECMDVTPNCSLEHKITGRRIERDKFQTYTAGTP